MIYGCNKLGNTLNFMSNIHIFEPLPKNIRVPPAEFCANLLNFLEKLTSSVVVSSDKTERLNAGTQR
ncbi:MAG: hypothetical protein DYG98_17035 [Haliscomenobacteraceae bacterium CHB4]|nr:hypothetical protein [Haliscomenobacteraceae bacterium CHB4]